MVLIHQVKNADGTVTIKKSQGTTTVRPPLRRNTSSANRLAAVAAGNNAVAKLQPLTRSKTADPAPTQKNQVESTKTSPQSQAVNSSPTASPQSREVGFYSAIYCSKSCALQDAGRSSATSKDLARTLSCDFSDGQGGFTMSRISTYGLPVTDKTTYAPPSPLFISGSESESSNAGADGPACSAPNTLEFFRLTREGPDDAWHDVHRQQQQRRSSVHPAIRPASVARRESQASTNQGWGDVSSTDSLSSMWNTGMSDADIQQLARSTSTGPKPRVSFVAGSGRPDGVGNLSKRSMSSSSDRSVPIAARPALSRSNLSHTSLGHSPPVNNPEAFGSAPDHTLDLLHSYHNAFPVRNGSGSSSYKQKGFVFPTALTSTTASSPSESRRASATSPPLQRPTTGTIRAKSKPTLAPEVKTWDAYGREEIEAHQARASAKAMGIEQNGSKEAYDYTPKQSLDMENGQWKIRYSAVSPDSRNRRSKSRSRHSTVSRRSFEEEETDPITGIAITSRPMLSTSVSSTSHGRTPIASATMPPPTAVPMRRKNSAATPVNSLPSRTHSTAAMPDLASLRVGSQGNIWSGLEKNGGKMYEIPAGLKVDRSKAGLFFFPA